jgi:hypothetical protein
MVTTTLCGAKVQGESTHGWEKKRQIGRVLQPQSGQGKPYFLAKVVTLVEYKIQTLPL